MATGPKSAAVARGAARHQTLDAQIERLLEGHVEAKMQELQQRVATHKHEVMRELAAELDYAVVSKGELQALRDAATRAKVDVDEEVRDRMAKETDKLQRELVHQLELRQLKHEKELVQLQERLRLLEPYAPGSQVAAVTGDA